MKIFNMSKLLIFITFITSNIIFSNPTEKAELFFSHERGFYYDNFTLQISCDFQNSIIRYTLDGSNPLTSSTSKGNISPIQILIDPTNFSNRDVSPAVIVTACATNSDTLVSEIVTSTYLYPEKINVLSRDNILPGPDWLVPGGLYKISYGMDPDIYNVTKYSSQMRDGFLSIPTFSLVTDLPSLFDPDSGIFTNALYHGKDWERNASLELIHPDGSEGFQINCGMRIRGGWSRHYDNPKHAFRFLFRSEYGESKLNYPLFGEEGVEKFDKIDLRTSQNYSWSYYGDLNNTFLREIFSRDTQRDMNQPYTRSRYYHLFINGTYWGLYQTQERSEAYFAKSYFGGNEEDYDVIKVDVGEDFEIYEVEATDGTLEKWKELWDAGEQGFSNDELYFKVQGLNTDLSTNPQYEKLLDVDNLIDYMIITFFTGDFDGPISAFKNNAVPNNFYAIYNRVNPDGFKFFRHDGEHTMFFNDWGIDRTGPYTAGENFEHSNPQWIHQKLAENSNYRLRFADRAYKHLLNNGALTLDKNRERILKRKSEIETAIVAESARWGDSKITTPRTKEDWSDAVNFILNDYLPTRNDVLIQQLKNNNLFTTLNPPQFNIPTGIVSKGTEVQLSVSDGDIYYTDDGSDPYSPLDDSNTNFSKIAIEKSATKKVLIPTSTQSSSWKSDINFDDSNWLTCEGPNGGVGYDEKGIYNQNISLDVKQYMHESASNPNTSCYIRIPFTVTSDELSQTNFMHLDIIVDDGFAAFINGVQVAESNVPSPLSWNSASPTYLDASGFQKHDISQYLGVLQSGENILAIHGVNISTQSSDFLILPILTIGNASFGGSISPNAKLYSNPIKITETSTIKTRTLFNKEWSALSESKFLVREDLSNLKITELHYHPLDEINEQDTISGKEFEFVEIKNIGAAEINLTDASFINGISYSFPQGTTLPRGQFFVIASNSMQFNNRYGFIPDGEFEGQLDNGGERIVFVNAVNDTTFDFTYDDKLPWPEEADGDGFSLVSNQKNPTGNPNSYAYWLKSGSLNGSPKADDLVSVVQNSSSNIPSRYSLEQNYPNPFNPSTIIDYSIPVQGNVKLTIFNVLGQEVSTLVNETKKAGNYSIEFNSSTSVNGQSLTSGIYFYKIESGSFTQSKKMLLLK